jgi:hypothetical protein
MPFPLSLSFFALYFTFIVIVAGHGYVHEVLIDGQDYPGWNPFADPYVQAQPLTILDS